MIIYLAQHHSSASRAAHQPCSHDPNNLAIQIPSLTHPLMHDQTRHPAMPSSSIELAQYGETAVSSTSRAVDALLPLNGEGDGGVEEFTQPYIPSTSSPYRTTQRPSTLSRILSRLWRPLICIFTPIALVFIYGLINPHIQALPPLPTVSISHGSSSLSSGSANSGCECGTKTLTGDAKRICEVYGKEGLERSRLFDGSGARVRRVMDHAKRDKRALKIGILGGSSKYLASSSK